MSAPSTANILYNESTVRDFMSLLKPRVMSLVVFTGIVGLFLAPGTIHPFIGFIAILCIAVGSGASGAINMWYDRDIDSIMQRTASRPIPKGKVSPDEALHFGILLSIGSVFVMAVMVNYMSAILLASAILFYIFIYTIWLKRRTPQNIVIGGAAGAFPPLIGWAAVTNNVTIEPLLLFAIIFMWTPPHFWALALYRNEDYKKANVPMLPVVAGDIATRRQILIYTLCLIPLTISPCIIGFAGLIYALISIGLGSVFGLYAWRVFRKQNDETINIRNAKKLFGFSILYLFLLFLGFVVDRAMFFPLS